MVYGYVITGYKLIKDLQAWLLPFVFNIRKVARGNVHFVAYFLAAFISACPRCFYGLPESCKVIQRYWSFCHNIRFHDLRHTAATNMHQLTGDFYTVGEVLGHTLAGIGVSLGLSMNFEAVTARYVDVRLERKKEVLDAYHGAVKQADPAKAEKAEPKKAKSAAKKKSSDLEL